MNTGCSMNSTDLTELKQEMQTQLLACADWSALVQCNQAQFRSEVRAAIASLSEMRTPALDETQQAAITEMILAEMDCWESRS